MHILLKFTLNSGFWILVTVFAQTENDGLFIVKPNEAEFQHRLSPLIRFSYLVDADRKRRRVFGAVLLRNRTSFRFVLLRRYLPHYILSAYQLNHLNRFKCND